MASFFDRIAAAFARTHAHVDHDVLEELAQHAEATFDALQREGFSDDEALAKIDQLIDGWCADPAALNRVVKRRVAPTPEAAPTWFAGAWADALYGMRLLRLRPGYAAVTILTIALGVGAVTMLFSVVNGVLLRPLPWATGAGLVRVSEMRGGREGRVPGTIMNGTYLAWSDAPQTIEGLGGWTDGALTLTGAGDASRMPVTNVTPNLFNLLDARPIRGRLFGPSEGQGDWKYVILSGRLWEQRFGSREDLIGKTIVLDGSPCTVVGIMPPDFQFPTSATQMWLPMTVAPVDGPNGLKRGQIFRAIARLKPGVSAQQAAAEATARATAAPDAGPVALALFAAKTPIQVTVTDVNEAATAELRPALVVLLLAAVLLFATAVANVANMQLARALSRQRELTIRAALGAGTNRLSRQLLIENGIVGLLGAALGLLLTVAIHRVLPSVLPAGFPRVDAIVIDGRVLMVAAMLAAAAGVVAGALPLFHFRRLDVAHMLADATHGSAGLGRSRAAAVRLVIVSSQVAVTAVLVIGATLLTRSFLARVHADRGYDPANVLTASVPFPTGYSFEQRQQARDRILERLKAHPGITHAAFSTGVPLMSAGGFSAFTFVSPLRDGVTIEAESIRRIVTPEYFDALSMRLRAGRVLTASDTVGSPTAVVVNRSFVRRYLDDVAAERAVGLSLGTKAVSGVNYDGGATIVGVVDDLVQDAVEGPAQPEMFVAAAQLSSPVIGNNPIVIARTVGDPVAYVEALRTAVREEDASIALDGVMTMEQRVGESVSRPRTYALLLGGFALCALVIAAAGLFGVLSQSVTQRSRELAVRSALGASRMAVVGVALKQMSVAMIAGVAIGLAASAGLSNNLASFVYGVSTRDWISFGIAPIVLILAGAIACIVPARRVVNANPVDVLREV